MKYKKVTSILLFVFVLRVQAQENAQTRVAASLAECYQDAEVFERDNRLPMTSNMLIELIRKVEDSPDSRQDIRQLAVSLVHRFRQDGIERASGVAASAAVLPFSPRGFQFSKHRLLLSRLVPGNAINFPNSTLTTAERCALHFMLSTSINTEVRGDEATRCNQLAQYRAMRVPRDVSKNKSNYKGDVEFINNDPVRPLSPKLRRQVEGEEEEATDIEEEPEIVQEEAEGEDPDFDTRISDVNIIDIASNAISQCPVENGVIATRWGAVSGGPLMTGLAAGLEPQTVTTRDLLALASSQTNSRQTASFNVDNRWAATLSGDLAEVALLQGPVSQQALTVGAAGQFNSTTVPRWYFLTQRERLEMTDAEIRGGLDGLILATNIVAWRNRASGLKLSQVLDMYYSQRGVFSRDFRACNRNALFTSVAPIAAMQAQTTAFSTVLDREVQLRVTLTAEGIQSFSNSAAEALSTYIPQSINDLMCGIGPIAPTEDSILRTAAELYIFVDTTWTFREIQPVVAYILDNVDVHRFGTRITLMNAMDTQIIVNTTNSLADFYGQWNSTNHQTFPPGLSLPSIIRSLHQLTTNLLNGERLNSSVGGRSKIALIMPQTAGVSESDTNFAIEQLITIREEVPDLRILFMAGGTPSRFARFVQDERRDIFPLRSIGTGIDNTIPQQANDVVLRIQQVPRRIINHRCGSNWQTSESGNNQMFDFVEPRGIVFYRVHPNYFFRGDGNRRVRIQGAGWAPITVCTSRTVENPRSNSSNQQNDDVNCRQILSDSFDINVNNICDGHNYIHHCPPVFISVEGHALTESNIFRCTEDACRFPDNTRYTIHAENLGCFSGSSRLLDAFLSLLLPLIALSKIFIS